MAYQVILLFGLLVASAFFSLSETTFTSSSPSKFYRLVRTRRIKRLLQLFDQKEDLISLILFGNNAVNIFASSLATYLAIGYFKDNPMFGDYALEISATVMTFTILIFSEIIPKTIAIRNPERIVLIIVDVYFVLLKIFKPFVVIVNVFTRIALKLVGLHESKQYDLITAKDSLRSEIEFYHQRGSVIQRDKEMLGGVLDLSEIKLHSVITHRTDVDMIDISDTTVEKIERQCIDCNHTRIPVYNENPDNILGILHFRDLFTLKSYNPNPTVKEIREILIKPQYASSETTLLAQLLEFKKTKNHIAIVVDEYGSMIGIVTLEDIVEEIVGDIEDEHDDESTENEDIKKQEDGSFVVDSSVLIRDFIRKTNLQIDGSDGVSTIAGLIIHYMHKIPKVGDSIKIGQGMFEVIDADAHRVKSVKVTQIHDETHDD